MDGQIKSSWDSRKLVSCKLHFESLSEFLKFEAIYKLDWEKEKKIKEKV